jgi:hypothetical protein
MAGLTIHLASTDIEFSVPLRDALLAEGLPPTQDPANELLFVVSVVADDPWNRAAQLRATNVARIFVLCTGHIDQPPTAGAENIVVRHWSDAETAALFVQQAFTRAQAELASAAIAPLPTTEPPDPEPEFVDEGVLMSPDEPEVFDDAQLMEPAPDAPPPQPTRFAAPIVEEVTTEDAEFIQRVFSQVREVDFRSPPPPPPRKALAGLDKKMQFLRDKVRELERDLARVGFIWSVKQRQVNLVEQVVASKEAERSTAVQRYTQMKEQATRAAAAARIESDTLRGKLNDLDATRNGIEGQLNKLRKESAETIANLTARLTKEEQEKTSLVAEFRSKMEAAQAAFTQLRDASTSRIADTEGRLKTTDETLAATEQARVDAVQTIVARDQTIAEQTQTLSERDRTIQKLQDEIAGLRADMEAQAAALKQEMEARTSELTRVMDAKTNELTQAMETERASAAARLVEIEGKLKATAANLHASLTTTAERDRTIIEVSDTLAQTRAELENRTTQLEQELAAIKTSRQGIQERLVEREKTLSAISEQMSREGGEHQERVQELKLAVKAKDEQLRVLTGEISSARAEFTQLANEFAKHRDEAGRISEELGQACADARAEARTSKDRIAELDREVGEWETRLNDAQTQLAAALEETRLARSDADLLGQKAAELQARADGNPPTSAPPTDSVSTGGTPSAATDGTSTGGTPQAATDGTLTGGTPQAATDGTSTGGSPPMGTNGTPTDGTPA